MASTPSDQQAFSLFRCSSGTTRSRRIMKPSLAILTTYQAGGSATSPSASTLELTLYIRGLETEMTQMGEIFVSSSPQIFQLSDLLAPSAVQEAIAALLPTIVPPPQHPSNNTTPSGTSAVAVAAAAKKINKLLPRMLSSYTHQAVVANATAKVIPPALVITFEIQLPPADCYNVVDNDSNNPINVAANTTDHDYHDDDESFLFEGSCPLCLHDYTFSQRERLVATPCFHLLHATCLSQRFERGGHDCPICHQSIAKEDSLTGQHSD